MPNSAVHDIGCADTVTSVPGTLTSRIEYEHNQSVRVHGCIGTTALQHQIGSFIGGLLSDIYGRRWVLIGSILVICIGTTLLFINIYAAFVFIGLGVGPANNISFVYVAEHIERRQLCSILMLCGWATGEIILGGIFSQRDISQNNSRLFAFEMTGASLFLLVLSAIFLVETRTFLLLQQDYPRRKLTNPLKFHH